MMIYLLLIIGLVGLIKGADILISGSFFVANVLKIPKVIIGLTVVTIGTCLPEASISIIASLDKNTELAMNNILGANFFNLLVVIGACAMIKNVSITDKNILKRDFPFLILFYVLNCFFCFNSHLGKIEGILLFSLFSFYIISLIRYAVNNKVEDENEGPYSKGKFLLLKNILMIVIGGACVHFCGNIVVDNAGEIAKIWGINPIIVSFSLLSFGAGLPELITSIVALRKNQNEIILGNVLGSNIINSSFVLGLCSFLNPISVDKKMFLNLIILLLSAVLIFVVLKQKGQIKRYQGIILLTIYFSYTLYLFFTN